MESAVQEYKKFIKKRIKYLMKYVLNNNERFLDFAQMYIRLIFAAVNNTNQRIGYEL